MTKFYCCQQKDKFKIMEVEVEIIPIIHHLHLNKGEWMAKIIKPISLYEKQLNKTMVPPIVCWWSLYDTIEDCKSAIQAYILKSKYDKQFLLQEELNKIQIVKLI